MVEKRNRTTDSPAVIPSKLPNNAGAFNGDQASPISSKARPNPLAAAITKVKGMMEGKEGPEWAMIQLLLGALEETQAENAELRRAIAEQQETIKRLTESAATTAAPNIDAEEKERRRSVVVSGLVETGGKPSERRADDKQRLDQLMDELDIDVDVTAAYRMGEKKGDRPRLLKVVLGSSKQQQSTLR